ncbi:MULTISPECIES: Z-ring formation inhibitor MciZ [Bacillus cereus group]|uniref:Z-ring formation inhibitor MciZ n=1 Tax=Bacillus wiedmannii TaxID=1890302 RepID=A0AB73RPV1_9BACI|nr:MULTISPECIES: Z-ring formation inhibitor MciZ [Bacillus cereus group]MBJ8080012.1 Z-ring formation inhibitor MciZ [Bacillus cereus group sp. N14]PEK23926.1 Z-ring formation inhibitor MciZ [Bacillus wiedmannii]
MKVYILPNRVTLVGKAWQIRHKLKQYSKEYTTVQEWITANKVKL